MICYVLANDWIRKEKPAPPQLFISPGSVVCIKFTFKIFVIHSNILIIATISSGGKRCILIKKSTKLMIGAQN